MRGSENKKQNREHYQQTPSKAPPICPPSSNRILPPDIVNTVPRVTYVIKTPKEPA